MHAHLKTLLTAAGGYVSFDRFMAWALYEPVLGYYARPTRKFGTMPSSGSDFVTAPELSKHFGLALARQVAQALQETGTCEIWEFGAGSGALAYQLLETLGPQLQRYTIVDISSSLRQQQCARLAPYADQVRWVSELPSCIEGVLLGNEVLDAMPVKLLVRQQGIWHERHVALQGDELAYLDIPTDLRPPVEIVGEHDYLTEIAPQAEGFIRTLADKLQAGAAFFMDYGFPEHEYYHAQRSGGTLMCHRAHQADAHPLAEVGHKDITAHVNFTSIALTGQEAGWHVLGYTSQAHFLLNCGMLQSMENASLAERVAIQTLIHEHEMGELFKVIGFAANKKDRPYSSWSAVGFASGDRMHRL